MWSDIIVSLITSVSEAACISFMNKRKLEKFNAKLSSLVNKLFDEFADSSLDNDKFFAIICSKPFVEMLRNYYFSIRDGIDNSMYVDRFEAYICSSSSQLSRIEVRRFINKLNELYINFLHNVIEENYELNAIVQILTISHREILGRILESEENLYKYIKSLDRSTLTISDKEILKYHSNCEKEYNKVRFTGISGAEDKEVQDLDVFYVENTFSYYSKERTGVYRYSEDEIDVVRLNNFFDFGNKIVLIGAAGLGKSTTLNYLFCNYEELFNANALKLKIDLKEYARDITENKRDILWCLAKEFYKKIKRTVLKFEDVERIISDFLDEGNCLVILDALDEIPTQAMRNFVRTEISNFCELYYLNRFVISTREVGYLRNKFDDSFLHIKINEFDNEQIKKYSKNWFKTNYKNGEFKEFWTKFAEEIQKSKCEKLIRNPIVLILALVIFDIEKNLPNRRVEFYKKCIDTFLVVREDRKAAFQMTEKIKNILCDDLVVPQIAHHKFIRTNEDAGYKFTNEEVKNAIMDAIEVPDKINWREPVNQYTNYLVNRTELLREIDEDKFDFAHKTFYEYFLAVYYSKMLDNQELVNLLNVWIGDANNDELARLIIEVIIEKNEPRQHKFIIDFLFAQIEEECAKDAYEESKEIDIFLIIADLYRNNMLLAKFHEQYYKCLIYHSKMVTIAERRRLSDTKELKIQYDTDILSQYYIQEVKDSNNFNKIIDAMCNLNNGFKSNVINDIGDDLYLHIASLFSWVQNNVINDRKKSNDESYKKELKYFMEDELELTLSCPQIFISIVDILLKKNEEAYISLLLEFNFEARNVFYDYTAPAILFSLIDNAFDSADKFLLFLISLIQCAKNRTNDLFVFALGNVDRKRVSDNEVIHNIERTKKILLLWEILNQLENTIQFKSKVTELSVYNKKYDKLYDELFNAYKFREQDIRKERVIKLIEKFNNIQRLGEI